MTNRLLATLLLTLPSMVAMVPAVAHSGRTIDLTLSPSGFAPRRIILSAGERVRLQMTSTGGAYTCRATGIRFDALIPAGGAATTVDVAATQTGTFPIDCFDDGDAAHVRAAGAFVVDPER